MPPKTGPDCFKCIHHQITWQPQTPYACRALGFKSRQIPSAVVRSSSGKPCMYFRPKPGA